MKNSEKNLMVLENFLLFITYKNKEESDATKVTFTVKEMYDLAELYIETDHADGRENPDD